MSHCYVWMTNTTHAAQVCAHCGDVRAKWEPVDYDGDVRRAMSTQQVHSGACSRPKKSRC